MSACVLSGSQTALFGLWVPVLGKSSPSYSLASLDRGWALEKLPDSEVSGIQHGPQVFWVWWLCDVNMCSEVLRLGSQMGQSPARLAYHCLVWHPGGSLSAGWQRERELVSWWDGCPKPGGPSKHRPGPVSPPLSMWFCGLAQSWRKPVSEWLRACHLNQTQDHELSHGVFPHTEAKNLT